MSSESVHRMTQKAEAEKIAARVVEMVRQFLTEAVASGHAFGYRTEPVIDFAGCKTGERFILEITPLLDVRAARDYFSREPLD